MTKLTLTALLAALAFTSLTGCKGNKEALEKCKTDEAALKDSDGCSACCKAAGSNGHTYMNMGEASCECM